MKADVCPHNTENSNLYIMSVMSHVLRAQISFMGFFFLLKDAICFVCVGDEKESGLFTLVGPAQIVADLSPKSVLH